jgi:nicotinate dehydrogenase subunit A
MPTPLQRTLTLNGVSVAVSTPDDTEPLLFVLRNQLDQHGPKFGCGVAQCGACTVLVNGVITRSCVTQLKNVADGAQITTLDGIGTQDDPHPLQRAFIDQQAGQCAYCINGMVMGALGWLQERFASGNRAVPSDGEVRLFLSGQSDSSTFVYICRCGSHLRIIRAIQQAAKEMA